MIGTLSPALPPARAYRVHREEYETVYPGPVLATAALPRHRPLGAGYAGAPQPPLEGQEPPPYAGRKISSRVSFPRHLLLKTRPGCSLMDHDPGTEPTFSLYAPNHHSQTSPNRLQLMRYTPVTSKLSLLAAYYQNTLRTNPLFATENDSSCDKKTSVPCL